MALLAWALASQLPSLMQKLLQAADFLSPRASQGAAQRSNFENAKQVFWTFSNQPNQNNTVSTTFLTRMPNSDFSNDGGVSNQKQHLWAREQNRTLHTIPAEAHLGHIWGQLPFHPKQCRSTLEHAGVCPRHVGGTLPRHAKSESPTKCLWRCSV